MAKWKVINVHKDGLTHREKFRDEMIEIPYMGHVVMDYEDAILFKSQFFAARKTPQGTPDPACYKMLKLEPVEAGECPVVAQKDFVCNRDGLRFPTQASLDHHIETNYKEEIVKDEKLEEEIAKEKRMRRGKSA